MRFARIEENAMDHPKFIAINAGAWRMWCEGNTYCQRQLTDGFIPATAVRGFRYYSAGALKQLLEALVPSKGPLWERVDGGYRMHDYLDWNDSAEKVRKARKDAKDRLERWKAERDKTRGVTPLPETRSETLRDVPSKQNRTEQNDLPKRASGDTAPARLAFAGKVLEVPRFLDDEFSKRLNGIAFPLTEFYLTLDQRLSQTGEPWDLRWIRDQFASESPKPERRRDEDRPFTAAEKTAAERFRRAVWGGCRHDPKCETGAGCIARIIAMQREKTAQAS